MKKKTKLHVVVILPAIFTLIIGGLLAFVLIIGTERPTAVAANASSASIQVASAAAGGAPGVSEGSEGSGEMAPNTGANDVVPPVMDSPACDFSAWIGKAVDQAALDATKRPVRVLKPNDAVTEDYSASRINVMTDPDTGIVTAVHCG